ncbi:MAG: hypothetical protein V1646_05115 [bacterium]
MDFKVRAPVIWASVLFVCAWFFMPSFKKSDSFYTINEFNEDVSKIYSDLGAFSQRRGDFQGAIKSYTRALAFNPEHSICLNNIEICKKKLKKNISNAVELFAKLDSAN